jgi:hypothetical protein
MLHEHFVCQIMVIGDICMKVDIYTLGITFYMVTKKLIVCYNSTHVLGHANHL